MAGSNWLNRALFVVGILIISTGFSQEKYRAVSLEIGGTGGFGSLNYEQSFGWGKLQRFDWKAGFSVAPIDKNNGTGLVFPLQIQRRFGQNHQLVLGIGQTPTVTTKLGMFVRGTFSVLYRYGATDKRFFVQAGYTPIYSYLIDFQWQNWGVVGFGWRL